MPEIAGLALKDASGNALTDASAAYLKEPNIGVLVDASGVLMAAIPIPPGLLQMIVDAVVGAIADVLLGGSGTVDLKEVEAAVTSAQESAENAYTAAQNAETAADGVASDLATHDAKLDGFMATVAGNFVNVNGELVDIEDAIAALEGGGGLTAEEHDKLIGLPDSSAIAGDVWGYTLPMHYLTGVEWGPMAGTVLQAIGDYLQLEQGFYGRPIAGNGHFRVCFRDIEEGNAWVGDWSEEYLTEIAPVLDLSLVQTGDTVWSFLNRTWPGLGWTKVMPDGSNADDAVWLTLQAGTSYLRCSLSDADIRACWPSTTEVVEVTTEVVEVTQETVEVTTQEVVVNTSPAWPGLSAVTLGTEVALVDDLVVTGPLHGLLFTITGTPVRTQKYMFGDVASWSRVGSVIFQTDRGDYERSQTFSLDEQVMVPQVMEVAASATIRLNEGWEGTVRPWLRS